MGLNDMNGRIQDAVTGRFLSADPTIPDRTNTQDFNRYSYVRNNPLSYIDPTGFASDTPAAKVKPIDSDPPPEGHEGDGDGDTVTVNGNRGGSTGGSGGGFIGSFGGGGGPPDMEEVSISHDRVKSKNQGDNLPVVVISSNRPQGHDYRTRNLLCRRPLTEREQRDLISRFTVPNVYTQDQPKTAGTYLVANTSGMPGGWVTTTFSPDGLSGANVTTPVHVFTGVVERSISNTNSGAYMLTHGYGGYSSQPQSPPQYSSLETGFSVDFGGLLDLINDGTGPSVFNDVDQEAAEYAMTYFSGC
jgi:hypothetical protein